MRNVVYVSGVHGCGKSTLRKMLEKDHRFLLHTRPGHCHFDEPYYRQAWRLTRYHIEALDQQQWSEANPRRIILGDRCVYDGQLYTRAFADLGWMSQERADQLEQFFQVLFPLALRPEYVVHLSMPKEWVKDLIRRRWEIEGQKWREDQFAYFDQVYDKYEAFYASPPCQVLRLTTTNRADQVTQIMAWLENIPHFAPSLMR
ncbi:MAG: deoxynucleoside kinase [Candidatus Kerfeldbacteria bacterium]|nr:deoxynucleoside kinase [Candidatus Kerfeldbacteria bacterium]